MHPLLKKILDPPLLRDLYFEWSKERRQKMVSSKCFLVISKKNRAKLLPHKKKSCRQVGLKKFMHRKLSVPYRAFYGDALFVSIRMGTFLTDTTAFSAGMYMLRASRKSIEIQRHCITDRSILCKLSFSNCKSCMYNCDDLHSYNHFTPQFTYTIFIYS